MTFHFTKHILIHSFLLGKLQQYLQCPPVFTDHF